MRDIISKRFDQEHIVEIEESREPFDLMPCRHGVAEVMRSLLTWILPIS